MSIAVIGAGAFGTGLANALALDHPVTLWGRNADIMAEVQATRLNSKRLPDIKLHANLTATSDLNTALSAQTLLLCLPTQTLADFAKTHNTALSGKNLIACCKGVDLTSGTGPVDLLNTHIPNAISGILTGPSFAVDIARGLPTALTLAVENDAAASALQHQLSTKTLRLYTTPDIQGAQLGGALKNVMAIGCGALMGAGLGHSARAALMTRGFAEMQRFALAFGALPETLSGLSGFGDMTLTCTSDKSRNYRFGTALGAGTDWTSDETVEGRVTAQAVAKIAQTKGIDMPITQTLCQFMDGRLNLIQAMAELLSRPLTQE